MSAQNYKLFIFLQIEMCLKLKHFSNGHSCWRLLIFYHILKLLPVVGYLMPLKTKRAGLTTTRSFKRLVRTPRCSFSKSPINI